MSVWNTKMRFKYTPEVLDEVLLRDNAVLVSYDGTLSKRSRITFICHCGKESSKLGYDLIKRIGAFCKDCALQRGFEKAKSTLKTKYNKVPICTLESLQHVIQRDNAILLKDYTAITQHVRLGMIMKYGFMIKKVFVYLIHHNINSLPFLLPYLLQLFIISVLLYTIATTHATSKKDNKTFNNNNTYFKTRCIHRSM